MKRSTLIISILLATLFVAPFIVAGYFFFFSSESVVLTNRSYRILRIDNPSLQAEDVVISEEPANDNTSRPFIRKEYHSLYYKGKKTYLPTVWEQGDTLYIGEPLDVVNDASLRLHVPAGRSDTVFLNGEAIYKRHP
ncbi:MAG: hypothetical protein LBS88_08425 [Tannerellaceae bacterium]|jgi:hypothetical protein|nr:hypothetical protein [Tannerellaceae bacterium]